MGVFGISLSMLAACAAVRTTDPHEGPREFVDPFSRRAKIAEAGHMDDSPSPEWWVNSGGIVELDGAVARTAIGPLPEGSPWRVRYARTNPRDTDGGVHPQNLFRLITRSRWQDFEQEVWVRVRRIIESDSPERNAWSGAFLLNRYADGNNLYYAGIRVDGDAVVKKKRDGEYTTLASVPVFASSRPYDRESHPNLIPTQKWIRLRTRVENVEDGVRIRLYLSGKDAEPHMVIDVVDRGAEGVSALETAGHAGVRTDFMEVELDSYRISSLDRGLTS